MISSTCNFIVSCIWDRYMDIFTSIITDRRLLQGDIWMLPTFIQLNLLSESTCIFLLFILYPAMCLQLLCSLFWEVYWRHWITLDTISDQWSLTLMFMTSIIECQRAIMANTLCFGIGYLARIGPTRILIIKKLRFRLVWGHSIQRSFFPVPSTDTPETRLVV